MLASAVVGATAAALSTAAASGDGIQAMAASVTALQAPTRFLSAAAFFGGFELGGVTGATVAVVLVHVLVGLVAGATTRPPPAALPPAPVKLP